MKIRLMPVLASLGLTACASDPQVTASQILEKQREQQIDHTRQVAKDIPSWYAQPPVDAHLLFAAGVATSADLSLATDKAILDAKRGLADQMAGRLSNSARHAVKEGAEEQGPVSAYERTTSTSVTEVALPGYVVQERAIQPNGAGFRVYVLLRYQPVPPDLSAQPAPPAAGGADEPPPPKAAPQPPVAHSTI